MLTAACIRPLRYSYHTPRRVTAVTATIPPVKYTIRCSWGTRGVRRNDNAEDHADIGSDFGCAGAIPALALLTGLVARANMN